jgi:hypothetical protein
MTRIRPERIALAAVVLLAAVLNIIHLDGEGYANTYYAAAVRSMVLSWHNFFFVSFDCAAGRVGGDASDRIRTPAIGCNYNHAHPIVAYSCKPCRRRPVANSCKTALNFSL